MADLDPERAELIALIERAGTDMATVSREIGRNHAYIQQYIWRGVPRRLPDYVRQKIADFLKADPEALGARRRRQSYLDLLLFPLRHESPECGAQFQIAVRGLVDRDSVTCPNCSQPIDLKETKWAIKDLAGLAAKLDELHEQGQ